MYDLVTVGKAAISDNLLGLRSSKKQPMYELVTDGKTAISVTLVGLRNETCCKFNSVFSVSEFLCFFSDTRYIKAEKD